eukprot:sb/3471632/
MDTPSVIHLNSNWRPSCMERLLVTKLPLPCRRAKRAKRRPRSLRYQERLLFRIKCIVTYFYRTETFQHYFKQINLILIMSMFATRPSCDSFPAIKIIVSVVHILLSTIKTADDRTDPYCHKKLNTGVMACKHQYQITPILESHPQLNTSPTTDVWICMLGNRLVTAKTYTKGCLSYNAFM